MASTKHPVFCCSICWVLCLQGQLHTHSDLPCQGSVSGLLISLPGITMSPLGIPKGK